MLIWPLPLLGQNPGSGDVNVTSQVPAAPPAQPAVILQPTAGQRFEQSLITVSGTCPQGSTTLTVEIYKNEILAGSTTCDNGRFSLQISLLPGKNILIARVRDVLDQYGPDSAATFTTNRGLTLLKSTLLISSNRQLTPKRWR